jgi:hypothetical protein
MGKRKPLGDWTSFVVSMSVSLTLWYESNDTYENRMKAARKKRHEMVQARQDCMCQWYLHLHFLSKPALTTLLSPQPQNSRSKSWNVISLYILRSLPDSQSDTIIAKRER